HHVRSVRASGPGLRRSLVPGRRSSRNESERDGRECPRGHFFCGRSLASHGERGPVSSAFPGNAARRRVVGVLWRLAARRGHRRVLRAERKTMRSRATGLTAIVAALLAMVVGAQEMMIDLSKETVGRTPTSFEPEMGLWVIAQDGADKVIKVDGEAYKLSLN